MLHLIRSPLSWCRAPLILGGVAGRCSALPGGRVPQWPTELELYSTKSTGAAMSRLIIGTLFAGLIIPEDNSVRHVAVLRQPALPVIAKRSLPLSQSSDLEEVASMLLGLSRSDRRTALGQALSLVAPEQRWTVLRLGLVGPGLGHQLAGHIAALPVPIPEAEWRHLKRQLSPAERELAQRLLSGEHSDLVELYAQTSSAAEAFLQAKFSASCELTALVASPKPKSPCIWSTKRRAPFLGKPAC